jgi:hypothetical protein
VFYVGEDSQLMLLAKRQPANPYLMTFFLDFQFATTATGANIERVESLQRRVQIDACARLADRSDALVIGPSFGMNAEKSLNRICPSEFAEIPNRFELLDVIENIRIYVRRR